MQKTMIFKLLAIGVLALLLMLAMILIDSLIWERKNYRNQAVNDIAASWTGRQAVAGPILVVPYEVATRQEVTKYENGGTRVITQEKTVQRYHYILPDQLEVEGDLATQSRYRGIHEVPVYSSILSLNGRFELEPGLGIKDLPDNVTFQRPFMILSVSDVRGIGRETQIEVAGKPLDLKPGTSAKFLPEGVHAYLEKLDFSKSHTIRFSGKLHLNGMEEFGILPVGKSTAATLRSAWPHPSFVGRYLPLSHDIGGKGFTARWETSLFASNMEQQMRGCLNEDACHEMLSNQFGVSLNQGVDIYLKAERSVKYALLFIGLTFVAFFLFEVLKGLRIHPVQYGLVGFALSVFYLLLVSLSEHIAFALAYLIAAAACIGLLGFYVSHVLKSMLRGALFAALLTALYGALYMLIRSEDFALLLGSTLLFAVLGAVMILTRHVDWFQLEQSTRRSLAPKAAEGAD